MTTAANQQVARTTQPKKDIRALLQSEAVHNQLRKVLPKHLTADRMARVMLTACIRTPKLLQCTPESLLQAMMLCSQAGLEPDGRHAHLIPFKDVVQVIFDYKGLIVLAERNGVKNIYADKVCENDVFRAWVEDGVKKLNHEIDFRKPRGVAYAYYASCRRSDMLDYEVMTKDEVDKIRSRSRAANDGPWVSDPDEMSKKTVLRRMSKRWDLSSEVAEIINDDDDTPADIAKTKRPAFGDDPFSALPEANATDTTVTAGAAAEKQTDKQPVEKATAQPANVQMPPAEDGDLGPETGKKEPPAPAPQNVEVPPEALTVALQIASFDKRGEADEVWYKRLIESARDMFTKSSVTEVQVLSWARKNKVAKDNQKNITDLAASKIVMLGKTWQTILVDVRKEATA